MIVGRTNWEPGYGKKTYAPDPKPTKRVKDSKAMKSMHAAGCFCVLNCGAKGETHHVLSRGQGGDDVAANLVCLCASHHQKITDEDMATRVLLGEHLLLERPDTITYIKGKLGEVEGTEWLARRLLVSSPQP